MKTAKIQLSAALQMGEAGPGCEWNHQPLPLGFPVQLALLEVLHKQFTLDLVGVKVKNIADILSDLVVSLLHGRN